MLNCNWNPCVDTVGWTSGQGMICDDYRAKEYCELLNPFEGSLKEEYLKYGGSHFNFPENNCCNCGIEQGLSSAVVPNTTVGCTHKAANGISKDMVEYCNVKGMSRLDCEEKQLTFRGYQCQWIPCSKTDTIVSPPSILNESETFDLIENKQ